jgi:hypothetical protein
VSWSWLFWWRPPCLLRVVLVNLISDDETALRGVLWSSRGPWLTLKDVSMIKTNLAPITMDGDAIVHRANVAFLQVLP